MIFNPNQVVWKLREGVSLPYGKKDEEGEEQGSASNAASSQNTESARVADARAEAFKPQSAPVPVTAPNAPAAQSVPEEKAQPESQVIAKAEVARIPQSQPLREESHLYNPSAESAVVDGNAVTTAAVASSQPRWMSLPYRLRQFRADVFVDFTSGVDFVESLASYLKKCGLTVRAYDDSVHYLPSDILLLDKSSYTDAGTVYILQQGKRYIFDALKSEFKDKLHV